MSQGVWGTQSLKLLPPLAGSDLLSLTSSAATTEVAVSAAPVSSGGKVKVPPVLVIDDDSGCVGSRVLEVENDVEPDSPLQLTAPDDEELAADCMSTTVDHLVTGTTSMAVEVPNLVVPPPVPVAPAAMCPAVAWLLASCFGVVCTNDANHYYSRVP